MRLVTLKNLPKLHSTPLAALRVNDSVIILEVDDEHEQRIRFVLRTYQALRMTTTDCFTLPRMATFEAQRVGEVIDSEWIADLKLTARQNDETATFIDKAHHYFFPLQDDFLEVIAWGIELERVNGVRHSLEK